MEPLATTQTVIRSLWALDSESLKKLQEVISARLQTQSPSIDSLVSRLRKAYNTRDLVPVLGAGVSMTCGIPDWNTLLQKLMVGVLETEGDDDRKNVLAYIFSKVSNKSPLIAARYLSAHFQSSDSPIEFERRVRNQLYASLNTEKSELVEALASLCVAPGDRRPPPCVITYNYDDRLEQAIGQAGSSSKYRSVFGINPTVPRKGLSIFHVHGFLPQNGRITQNNHIVLSEELYHQQYTDQYSWNNIVQITNFSQRTCLFIGLSFSDPNLRRLLDIAHKLEPNSLRHVMIHKKYSIGDIRNQLEIVLKMDPQVSEALTRNQIPMDELVATTRDLLIRFDEIDAESLGVQMLWTKEYSDIPEIITRIAKEEQDSA